MPPMSWTTCLAWTCLAALQGPLPSPRLPDLATASTASTAPSVRRGGLRQVQLLEVSDGDVRRMRFVTTYEVDGDSRPHVELAEHVEPIVDDAPRALGNARTISAPVASMVVPLRPSGFPSLPWEARPAWSFVELGDFKFVVVEEAARACVTVLQFPNGRVVAELKDANELHDARPRGGALEVLYRSDRHIFLARIDPETGVEDRQRLAGERDSASVSAFVEASPGSDVGEEVVVLARRGSGWFLEHVLPGGGEPWALALPLDDPWQAEARVRVAGFARGDRRWFLATNTGYHNDVGIAISVERRVEGPVGAIHKLFGYGVKEQELANDRADGTDVVRAGGHLGQAIAILEAKGEDEGPRALLTLPTGLLCERVQLHRVAGLTSLAAHEEPGFRYGSSLSVSPCGDYVLVGGCGFGWPDHPSRPGFVQLLRVGFGGSVLRPVGSWQTVPTE